MPHIVHIVHIVHLPRSAGLVIQKSSKKVSGPDCPSVHRNHYPLIRQHPPACPATAPSERAGQKALSARVRPPSPVSLISLIRRRSRVEKVVLRGTLGADQMSAPFPPLLAATVRGLPTVAAIRLRPAILVLVIIVSVLVATITDMAMVGWCHPGMEPY